MSILLGLLLLAAASSAAAISFPLRTSGRLGDASITGCQSFVFSVDAVVGGSPVSLLIDTGSTTLVVASTYCDANAGCGAVTRSYNPVTSPTSSFTGHAGTVQYEDGAEANGYIFTDNVRVANTTVNIPFLAIYTANDGFFSYTDCSGTTTAGAPYDGILGLAYAPIEISYTQGWLATLAALPGIVDPVVSLWFCEPGGEMTVGPVNTSHVPDPQAVHYASLTAETYYQVSVTGLQLYTSALPTSAWTFVSFGADTTAVVDSGTSLLVISSAALSSLEQWFETFPEWLAFVGTGFFSNGECLRAPTSILSYTSAQHYIAGMLSALPLIHIRFQSGFDLVLTPTAGFVWPTPLTDGVHWAFCPGVTGNDASPIIIGYTVLQQFTTLFDLPGQRVGFVPNTDPTCMLRNATIVSAAPRPCTSLTLVVVPALLAIALLPYT